MHAKYLVVGTFLASLLVLLGTPSFSPAQFPGGGWPGGGRGLGGKGFGGRGGGGGSMFFVSQDPQGLFDKLAKGRDHFLISETFTLREPLTQFAKDQGIAGEKINREAFLRFGEQMKAKMGGSTGGKPEGTSPSAKVEDDPGANFRIEFEFRRRDANSDGVLNFDEMPDGLREELARWDKNDDKVIDLGEFRAYFQARMQQQAGASKPGDTTTVIEVNEEDLDRRPVVYRAGKLPKELETMFKELDTDGDGQIDLAEWRAAGKSLSEFQAMDRNEDGLLVPEEILRHQAASRTAANGNGARTGPGFGSFGGGFRRGGGGFQPEGGGGGFPWTRPRRSGN